MTQPIDPSQSGEYPANARNGTLGSCAPASLWRNLAAGELTDPDESLRYLAHASRCARCGALLADAIALQNDEPTASEEAQLAQLRTSSASGQRRLAKRLHRDAAPQRVLRSSRRPLWFLALGSAGMAVVAALGFLGFQRLRPPSDAALLVAAYDQHRISELRIPGSAAVPLASPTRGEASGAASSDLLKVKLQTQLDFERTPNDPRVRQRLGEIAVVERDPETARRAFEMADALDPNLPRLKFDMGTAYFELAEANDRPLDYARATDLFLQYLQEVHRQDAVALFDVGLCWERQAVVTQAVKSFEAALALEKNPGWRAEIERHLAKLKAMTALDLPADALEATLTPEHFLNLAREAPGEYELYLDAASRNWLLLRGDSPHGDHAPVDAALAKLAGWGLNHDDRWLADMLRSPPTPAERLAERTLAQAIQANAGGNADQALAASAKAMKEFQTARNRAGELRAQAEHIYSLARSGEFAQSVHEAEPALSSGETKPYLSIQMLDRLEVSVCSFGTDGASAERQLAQLEALTAKTGSLPNAKLRAIGFEADEMAQLEHLGVAWSTGVMGLRQATGVVGSEMRQYQLTYNLEKIARSLRLRWVEAGLASAAAEAATHSSHRQAEAYSYAYLGAIQTSLGERREAASSFDRAENLAAAFGDGTAAKRYLGDIHVQAASLNAEVRGTGYAIEEMERQRNLYDTYPEPHARLRYYAEYSDLLLQANDIPKALAMAWRSVANAEKTMAGIAGEADRQSWLQGTKRAYEQLVLCLIESGHIAEALRAWEWRQTATYRRPLAAPADETPLDMSAAFPRLPPQPPGIATVVVARLEDRYFAWSIQGGPRQTVRMHEIALSPNVLLRMAEAFQHLCGDPQSSATDLTTLGSQLYRAILGPLQGEVEGAKRVQFDLDRSLAALPMAALSRDGRFLGLDREIVFLPPVWSLTNANRGRDRLPPHPHLMMVEDASVGSAERIPEEYNEANDIAREFPGARLQQASIVRDGPALRIEGAPGLKRDLAQADIFHYAGHWGADAESQASEPGGSTKRARCRSCAEFGPGSMTNLRLAVLAACRTGNEREESAKDVPSFARVLMAARASSVLASTWDVDSVATRTLMVAFYRGLAEGRPFAEALRLAQVSVERETASAHPYFWASFQLIEQ